MLTQGVIATAALLAASVHAAPSRLADRVARRQLGFQHDPSTFKPATGEVQGEESNTTHPEYSSNWSGAVIESPPSGQTFNTVTGTFVIPSPKVPSGGRGTYSASAWVGIDGDTYQNALFQTGCDFTASSSGGTSYDCWHEWIPDAAIDFTGFTPQAGDTIVATVTSTSKTAGVASLKNTRTGQTVSKNLNAPSSSASLGGQNAEWIVEDFESGGGLVPFANFGTVTFSSCSAGTGSSSVGTSGATLIDIQQNGQTLTDASIPSNSQVRVSYV